MPIWACGHEGQEGDSRLCPHLVGADLEEGFYHRVLRGRGLEYDMCCSVCTQATKNGETIEWLSVCQACVDTLNENEWNFEKWIGQAGIKERPISFDATLHEIVLDEGIASAVAVAPLSAGRFVGYGSGTLFLIDEQGLSLICAAPLPSEKDCAWAGHHLTPRLHTSLDGRFVALVNDFGRYGLVFDLQGKRLRMRLDRGTYYPETQPFSVAFVQKNERTLVIHATNWNRLKISDAQKSEIFVRRGELAFQEGKQPEHNLYFFHGTLLISPEQNWIADDVWVWHPNGDVIVWNLNHWLNDNANESADGKSRRGLCCRDYLWNVPLTWISNKYLAVWGIGRDEASIINGARVFDVSTGIETATFAGPEKTAFFGGHGRLFSIEDQGLNLWDASTGERVGIIDGFQPQWQRGDFLIEMIENRVRAWNWRTAFDEK